MASRHLPFLDEDENESATRCLYEILGLSRSATPLEVKAAFRAAARRLHPDRLQGSERKKTGGGGKTAAAGFGDSGSGDEKAASPSGAAFAAAREAFLVLSDPVRRASYDALGIGGASWYRSRGGRGGGGVGGRGGEGGERGAFWPAEAATTTTNPTTTAASAAAAAAAAASAYAAAARRKKTQTEEASAALLAGLGHLRGRVDPRTQLVLTCGLCSRPAGVSCSVCLLPLCALCCRRRHARAPGDFVGGNFAAEGKSSSSSSFSSSSSSSSCSLAFRPHWPLVDAPGSMSRRLAARELEAKRLADAALEDAVAPHVRGRQELEDVRELRERYLAGGGGGKGGGAASAGAFDVAAGADGEGQQGSNQRRPSRTSYDPFLSRFYAWDQTPEHVLVAVRLPTGDADRGLRVEVAAETAAGREAESAGEEEAFAPSSSSFSSRPTHRLLVAADGAPPVIDRVLARAVAAQPGAFHSSSSRSSSLPPVLVRRSADNRSLLLTIAKAVPGEQWPRLFVGDSLRARCVDPPYAVREGSGSGGRSRRSEGEDDDNDDENDAPPSAADDGAVVEVELCPRLLTLPAWVEKRHVTVETTAEKLSVRVQGAFELERYFWDSTGRAVLPGETTWCLERKKGSAGEGESGGNKGPEEEAESERGVNNAKTPPSPTAASSSSSSTLLLTVTLVRPSSSPSNDNRRASRPDGKAPGRRFFACDDDFYGLEDSVAAGVLSSLLASSSAASSLASLGGGNVQVGAAVRAPPWRHAAAAADEGRPRRVRDAALLPLRARRQLEAMLEEEENEDREGGETSSDDDDSDDDSGDDGF